VKPHFTHYCFDLDGTLIDSSLTIYKTTEFSLNKLGIEFNVSKEDFALTIGKHFIDIFDEFGIKVNDFEEFITIYKNNYFNFIDFSIPYPEVENTFYQLKKRGAKISLLTTKMQEQAEKIVSHFNLANYFDLVMGRRNGIAHKPSPEPFLLICDELNVKPKDSLLIGDTELDIQCGKNAGSSTCGVLYGYRTRELIEKENPDFIADSIVDILNI
jgi:HAD superfamily hydrolase (TIGR01549 family)